MRAEKLRVESYDMFIDNSQPSTIKNGGLHVLRCHENKNHIKIENRTHTFSKTKSCSARQGFIAVFYMCGAACEIF